MLGDAPQRRRTGVFIPRHHGLRAAPRLVRPRRKNRGVHQPRLPFGDDSPAPLETVGEDRPLSVVGLFAGVGGLEEGLHRAGHRTELVCEYDDAAAAVLAERFKGARLARDVRKLAELPESDLVAAGFPCQDLSIAGRAVGIDGARSSLVAHVFRLLDAVRGDGPRWLLLENVPFMLQLQGGRGMRFLVTELERRGYAWAYRVVDSRAFGLPQRRRRVLLLASRTHDPRPVLLAEEAGAPQQVQGDRRPAFGFYWTEGHRGIGWSIDCVPPIKVGSGLGIPSPPAIWLPNGRIVIPDVRDLERLQGFEADWTEPAEAAGVRNARWRLIGNAVTVPVAAWVGERLRYTGSYDSSHDWPLGPEAAWPAAAWGLGGERCESGVSGWPRAVDAVPLSDFLQFEGTDISPRGAAGLLNRLRKYGARVPEAFVDDLERAASDAPSVVRSAA